MDDDLELKSEVELIAEIKKLRNAIRKHRDSQSHDLCWYHPEMWNLLPESVLIDKNTPEWCEFMKNCATYRKSLDANL